MVFICEPKYAPVRERFLMMERFPTPEGFVSAGCFADSALSLPGPHPGSAKPRFSLPSQRLSMPGTGEKGQEGKAPCPPTPQHPHRAPFSPQSHLRTRLCVQSYPPTPTPPLLHASTTSGLEPPCHVTASQILASITLLLHCGPSWCPPPQ